VQAGKQARTPRAAGCGLRSVLSLFILCTIDFHLFLPFSGLRASRRVGLLRFSSRDVCLQINPHPCRQKVWPPSTRFQPPLLREVRTSEGSLFVYHHIAHAASGATCERRTDRPTWSMIRSDACRSAAEDGRRCDCDARRWSGRCSANRARKKEVKRARPAGIQQDVLGGRSERFRKSGSSTGSRCGTLPGPLRPGGLRPPFEGGCAVNGKITSHPTWYPNSEIFADNVSRGVYLKLAHSNLIIAPRELTSRLERGRPSDVVLPRRPRCRLSLCVLGGRWRGRRGEICVREKFPRA
jgi:hypothetical protein